MKELEFLDKIYACYKEIDSNGYDFFSSDNYSWLKQKEIKENLYKYYKKGKNKVCLEFISVLLKYVPNFFENVDMKKIEISMLNIKEVGYQIIDEFEKKENVSLQDKKVDAFGVDYVIQQQI